MRVKSREKQVILEACNTTEIMMNTTCLTDISIQITIFHVSLSSSFFFHTNTSKKRLKLFFIHANTLDIQEILFYLFVEYDQLK